MNENTSDRICYFAFKYNCSEKEDRLIECGSTRIANIIRCSKTYNDGKVNELQESTSTDVNFKIVCHKSCVSSYTSNTHIQRYLKRKEKFVSSESGPSKKTRLSLNKQFSFRDHCIFCGEDCSLIKDPKNPSRWQAAYMCREILGTRTKRSLKDYILDTCAKRNDEWAADVHLRLEGAVSDLHAADARYHVTCKSKFMSPNSVTYAGTVDAEDDKDVALECLLSVMTDDKARVWNSVELFDTYKSYDGTSTSRDYVIQKVMDCFGKDLLMLTSSGLSSIFIFRSKASKFVTLVDDLEDDIDDAISKLVKRIKSDVKKLDVQKSEYSTGISLNDALQEVSMTLLEFISRLSPRLDKSLPAALIGSIVTSVLVNQATSLQVALGVLIRESKQLINYLNAFNVTCSYDEVLRFKKSAAVATTQNSNLKAITDAKDGLVQVIVDNFDAEVSSPNGKLSTHSLAVLVAQTTSGQKNSRTDVDESPKFRRVKKDEMSHPIDYDFRPERYQGPKQPDMLANYSLKSVLPLRVLAQQILSKERAESVDTEFLIEVLTNENCPEYNGYNTAQSRMQGHSLQPKAFLEYTPLIDLVPSDPDTMMTSLAQAQQMTSLTGQNFVVFTCDLQLFRVAQKILWAYPERFNNVILRLGGMHLLMSYLGAVGSLMAESGLAEVMESVFGGVAKMLTGKKFPQNVRAMRFVMEEILRDLVIKHNLTSHGSLTAMLDEIADRSKTSKLWVNCFIKPVLLMMQYIRAEREGDWPLHLLCVQQMIPYFFASSHIHYARYALLYLRNMESLPSHILKLFMKGQHVMRHIPGLWNGIWSDMFIETTFMRYGHGKSGIIGITLKPETLKVWALGLHICNSIEACLSDMVEGNNQTSQTTHKEEGGARIKSDAQDRDGLRRKLQMVIDPLDSKQHPENIVNIITGRVGPPPVNVHDSLEIGKRQMQEFEKGWPEGFYGTIQKKVVTMAATKKHVRAGEEKVFDTSLIYSRVIGLQASSRNVDIHNVLSHELAPVPTSMFTDTGEMRIAKGKAALKKLLQVEVSAKTASTVDTVVIDGSALLWVVNWPAKGTVRDFFLNFKFVLQKRLSSMDVYLIFDRYYEYSTKGTARSSRTKDASRVHKLTLDMPLPPQKVVLGVTGNKSQLIEFLCTELIKDSEFHKKSLKNYKLILTGQNPTPIEISKGGVVVQRHDMDGSHEEADVTIIQQVLSVLQESPKGINIVSDDTDVFVLLLYFYLTENMTTPMLMESPVKGRNVIDIKQTVVQHEAIIGSLLGVHALSGCDTVASCYGIGKGTALKVLRSGLSLSLLGDTQAPLPEIQKQARMFMLACYGLPNHDSMSKGRVTLWSNKIGKGKTTTPALNSLPPTDESFNENVKRAHYQACIWRSAKNADPPDQNVEEFGWTKDPANKSLDPVTVPPNVSLAPESILKLVQCGCKSEDTPCRTLRCSCRAANLPCTIFCSCQGRECCNSN